MIIGESEAKAIAQLVYKDIIATAKLNANEETNTRIED